MNFKKLLLIILLFLPVCSLGCKQKVITKSNLALDTVVTITLYDGGDESTVDRAFELINNYDKMLDAHDPSSEINKITTDNTVIDDEVLSLLESNLNYNKITGNALNPTLGRLINLWDINEPVVKEAPREDEINNALIGSEADNLIIDKQASTARVTSENTKIDLGASSKGFIADKLKEFLKKEGVKSAIINLGGNILTIGQNGSQPFKIGVDYPDAAASEALGVLDIDDKSVVTSGNYQRFFTDQNGKKYHHILNPATGYPAESGLDEVVVISDSSLEGDMLSTSFFIMGKDKTIEFLETYENKNISVILVGSDKNIWLSKDLESNFKLEPNSNEYKLNFF